jgi:hypothetical protein
MPQPLSVALLAFFILKQQNLPTLYLLRPEKASVILWPCWPHAEPGDEEPAPSKKQKTCPFRAGHARK